MKLKILYVHHGAVPGGAPTSLRNLVRGVSGKGYQVVVGCIHTSMISFFSGVENIDVMKYPVTGLLSGRFFIAWSRLSLKNVGLILKEIVFSPFYIYREIKFIKELHPDCVHLNSSILWMSAIAAKYCRKPLVWHIREASFDSDYNVVRRLYAWFIRSLADKVVCIGPHEYSKLSGGKSDKVALVYNSLDDSYFVGVSLSREELRAKMGLPAHSFLCLSLGGGSFRKGAYQLVGSLDHLSDEFALVIAGSMPETGDSAPDFVCRFKLLVENFLIEKGIKKFYSWGYDRRLAFALSTVDRDRYYGLGVVDDVKQCISACDVLVFAGTTPHSGRPVYEAWALKKPVLVFDSEVMRMDVEDGVDGMIVHEQTPEALAEALRYLKAHPGLCKKMGEAGYKKARDRFSLKENTDKLLGIYKEILGESSF